MTALAHQAEAALKRSVGQAQAAMRYEDLTVDESLELLANIEARSAQLRNELDQVLRDRADVLTQITLLMEQQEATKFEGFGWRARIEWKKTGSASVHEAAALRAQLVALGVVPAKELDDALPIVTPEPIVKPDLRKVRKLAEYGNVAARVISAHIAEPIAMQRLVVEPVIEEKNVTGTVA